LGDRETFPARESITKKGGGGERDSSPQVIECTKKKNKAEGANLPGRRDGSKTKD